MKNYSVLFLLLLSTFTYHAQAQDIIKPRQLVTLDKSKIIGHTSPNLLTPVPCGGSANTQSVDLKWKPILVKKVVEIEHGAPNQDIIDSIKAAKLKLKMEYEQSHLKSGEKTTFVTPVIGTNFAGNTNDGSSPLDNTLAISNGGYIVSIINSKIEYYNTSGTNVYSNSITSFLPVSFGVSSVCDPVVIYDSGNDRFIFFCQQSPLVSGGKIFISFSKTNNHSDGWWCYQFYGDPTPGNFDAFDYPKLAVNDSEVFLTGNLFYEPAGNFHQAVIFQWNKLAGYAGGTLNGLYWNGITGAPFTLLPLSWGQLGDVTGGMLFVSTSSSGGSSISLYQIAGNWCCSPVMSNWSVSTTAYSAPANAYQLGTSCLINTGDCRALSGFILNGYIHFVFNSDAASGYTGINYNSLNISTLTNSSSVFGLTGYDYGYGAVASFATTTTDKSVMIGFGRTGSSIYPEIRVVNCDDAMTWSGSALVHSSIGNVSYTSSSVERWGDYTGVSRKHNSATPSIWMSGMYGNSSHSWNTWIAQINAGITGISELENETKTKVYPNPVTEKDFKVEFSLLENADLNIILIDVNGRLVKELYNGKGTEGDNIFSFNKGDLTNGVFFLTIKSNRQIIRNEKIVIAD